MNQIQNSCRVALVLCTLGEEQETLACLGGMRSIAMSNICLLVVKITRQMLVLERFVTEPEELLRDEKAPVQKIVQWGFLYSRRDLYIYFTNPGAR